ncbi:hypothetical protein TNCV_5044101 [Trichonephila clavipes]|uniref:Uncharacterized protein n=1 Tax=Trichonephila clavipes TaxID=2585209 RepID=A0A8X6WHT9_TRICX|nr:hypothetical protein TNCV_5044101 [Trichonephila clavipes]
MHAASTPHMLSSLLDSDLKLQGSSPIALVITIATSAASSARHTNTSTDDKVFDPVRN